MSASVSSRSILGNMLSHRVFVYGTLKRGEPNHHFLLEDSDEHGKRHFVGVGTTKDKYPLVTATEYQIPFLLEKPGYGKQIKGEIYEVDDKMLTTLDKLEDAPKWYQRKQVPIISSDSPNEETVCWLYTIANFRKDLLDLEMLENFSASRCDYVPRHLRTHNNYKDQIRD